MVGRATLRGVRVALCFALLAGGCHWVLPLGPGTGRDAATPDLGRDGRGLDGEASDAALSETGPGSRDGGAASDASCPPATWCQAAIAVGSVVLYGVWGTSDSDVHVVGGGGLILHFDGGAWSTVASPTKYRLNAVSGSGPGDVYAVGELGVILHDGGGGWAQVRPPVAGQDLKDVFATTQAVVAVGFPGLVLQGQAGQWTSVGPNDSTTFSGVSGSGPEDILAVGTLGAGWRYNGVSWAPAMVPATVHDLCFAGAGDAFGIGSLTDIFRYDGSSWSPTAAVVGVAWHGIWAGPGPRACAVGSFGAVHVFDGAGWSPLRTGLELFYDVWVSPAGTVHVVGYQGASGVIYVYRP